MYQGHGHNAGSHYTAGHDEDESAGYQGGGSPHQMYENKEGSDLYNKGSETDLYSKFKRDEMIKHDEKASAFDELVEETSKKVASQSSDTNKTPEFAPELSPELQDAAARNFLVKELQNRKTEESFLEESSPKPIEFKDKKAELKKAKEVHNGDTIEDHIFEAIQNAKSS